MKLTFPKVIFVLLAGLLIEANIAKLHSQVVIAPRTSSGSGGGSGNFTGPGGAVAHNLVGFSDTSGIVGEDSGLLASTVITSAGSYSDPAWLTAVSFAKITSIAVTEVLLSFSDITTANVSTTKHGLAPKLPNDATKYLDGSGAYSVPAGSGTVINFVTKTANYTLVHGTDDAVECLTNAFTITLPTAVGHRGALFIVKNLQTANACTVATTSAETIDGSATVGVTNNSMAFKSDNTNWRIVNSLGLSVTSSAQGDLIYFDSASTVARLAKSTATYSILNNSGTSNNPAWATTMPVVFTLLYSPAVCISATPSGGFSSDVTLTLPTVNCVTGSNTNEATYDFTGSGADLAFQGHIRMPHDTLTTNGIDFYNTWYASPITGVVVWTISYNCVGAGEAGDKSWTTTTFNSTVALTTNQYVHGSKTGLTGCAADNEFYYRIERHAGAGSDTLAGTAKLVSFEFDGRRTITFGG